MQTNPAQAQQPGQLQVAGETHIGNEVIASIEGMAARDVEGVASLGKSSVGTAIGERVGSRETRARGVAVEAGRKEAILASMAKRMGHCPAPLRFTQAVTQADIAST